MREIIGNGPLLLFSGLLICLVLLYLKRTWPDYDIIDMFIIFITLHFGVYPFIRGLYFGKGVVFDTFNNSPLVIALIYLQLLLIVVTIRLVSSYFPEKINKYLKLKFLIEQWARVNNSLLISLYCLLIAFQFISYFKYGVKSHISPADFAKIGKDLPYWFMSVRTIYNFLALCVFIVLVSKAVMLEERRYFWIILIITFLPFLAYMGRKGFANNLVIGVVIWLVNRRENIFRLKYLSIATLTLLAFFLVSNVYETYRANLHTVGVSVRQLENPISAALNFQATLENLMKARPGTWEFNYLVVDRQLQNPENTTNGKLTRESFKGAIPRVFWPGKKFLVFPEIIADLYGVPMNLYNVGTNMFGVAQLDFRYLSLIIVPFVVLSIMIIMAGIMQMSINYPVFLWLFSVSFINYFICIEENQFELFVMARNLIATLGLFSLYLLIGGMLKKLRTTAP